ncbi:MAG: molybdopterin-dependent oxidoreductase, partial [Rubrivivax sp.]|nr:molybdopterin-dependent oxidoreductase [Rubrivivax sp.]
ARETLVQAAMNQQGDATRGNYAVDNGVITHLPTGTTYTYGDVAAAASKLTPPSSAPLVPDSEFKSIGLGKWRRDIPSKVDGSAIYGLDVRLPEMVYAVIKHCPTFGGALASVPSTPAGMIAVVPTTVVPASARGIETVGLVNAVAVVGPNTWDTWQAANRLRPNWTLPPSAVDLTDATMLAQAQALATGGTAYVPGGPNPPGTVYTVERSDTDPVAAIGGAKTVVEATYTLPYLPHMCMEVLNCTVDYVPGERCEVWAPTQMARNVLALVTGLTGLPESQVTIHTTLLGGGLGRKAEVDFVAQAVQVAMAVQRPVKLMWPRPEDATRDQYRPMALVRARAGLDASRRVVGWTYRNVSPSILGQRGVNLGPKGDSQGYEGSNELPYEFAAHLTEYVTHPSTIPVGFWRSVGASINTFAVECMIDELAAAAGEDPWLFRRKRLSDPRWLKVLNAAAKRSGWGQPVAGGGARGIAIGRAFNTICAQVVEIASVTATTIKVRRVTVAVDPYLVVNPLQVEAQIVGGVVHGLNAALYGGQTFSNGVPGRKNFNQIRMLRLNEMPKVVVKIIGRQGDADRSVPIGGIGELGVPTLAPALANAYFALTGQRRRDLPFFPGATMGGG